MATTNKIKEFEHEGIHSNSPSSATLLKRINSRRKTTLKAKPPDKIDKIICKNGCRLGSD